MAPSGGYHVHIHLSPESSFLQRVCLGIVEFARQHNRWDISGLSRGIGIPVIDWHQSDGIICNIADPVFREIERSPDIPVVGVGTLFQPWIHPAAVVDNQAIGRLACDHLLDLGLLYLAFSGTEEWAFSVYREQAFRQRARQAGIEVDLLQMPFRFGEEAARAWHDDQAMLRRWLEALPKPCGLFACDDRRAAELVRACRDARIRMPEDVAIIGVNNDELICEAIQPRLSSIDTNARQLGFRAAELLDQMLEQQHPGKHVVMVSPRAVVQRESTNMQYVQDKDIEHAIARIRRQAPWQPLKVEDITKDLPMSSRDFHRRFRREFNTSPKQEIIRVRLKNAKRLLHSTDWPIKRVAAEMGFVTPNEFSRFFHAHTNMSPLEYRNSVNK